MQPRSEFVWDTQGVIANIGGLNTVYSLANVHFTVYNNQKCHYYRLHCKPICYMSYERHKMFYKLSNVKKHPEASIIVYGTLSFAHGARWEKWVLRHNLRTLPILQSTSFLGGVLGTASQFHNVFSIWTRQDSSDPPSPLHYLDCENKVAWDCKWRRIALVWVSLFAAFMKNWDCDLCFFYLDGALPPPPPSWQVQVEKTLWNCDAIPKKIPCNILGWNWGVQFFITLCACLNSDFYCSYIKHSVYYLPVISQKVTFDCFCVPLAFS